MSPRLPISAKVIDNKVHKVEEDKILARIESEPVYQSQNFDVPKELIGDEIEKWKEIVKIIVGTDNSPNSDADKDTMISYCKCWVRCIKKDEYYQKNPDDRENYKQMMDNWKLLDKLKSDLMLDPVSRARMGLARAKARKIDGVDDIFNRPKD